MNFFFTAIFFILTLGILYLIFNHRFSKILDQKFEEKYSRKMRQDMQEFYREMETYSLIFDNKIKSFKNLMEKQQDQIVQWQEILSAIKKSKNGKDLSQLMNRSRKKDEQIIQILSQIQQISGNKDGGSSTVAADSAPTLTEIPRDQSFIAAQSQPKRVTKTVSESRPPLNKKQLTELENSYQSRAVTAESSAPAKSEKVSEKNDPLFSFIKNIGKTLAPTISASQQTIDDKLKKSENPSGEISKKENKFEQIIQEKLGLPPQNRSIREDDPVYQALSFDDEEQEPSAGKNLAARLNPDDLLVLIKKIQKASERPKALQTLLGNGFELSQIAELSQVSLGELELTRKIHGG